MSGENPDSHSSSSKSIIILCTKCKNNICGPGPSIESSKKDLTMISSNCCHLYHASCLDVMLEEQKKKNTPEKPQDPNSLNCLYPGCNTQSNTSEFIPIKPLTYTPQTEESLIDDLENIITKLQSDKQAIEDKYERLVEYVKKMESNFNQGNPIMPPTHKSFVHSSIEETDIPLDSILRPPPPPPFHLTGDDSDEDTAPPNVSGDRQPHLQTAYFGIFKPTGASPKQLIQTSYEDEFFYFASEFLMIGDGYVFNSIREATNHRSYKETLLKSRLYSPQFRITHLVQIISALPSLPPKIILSVGGADTREKNESIDKLVAKFRRLLHVIYEKGTRTIITLPTIPYRKELPIRKQFNKTIANKKIVDLDWTYEHIAGITGVSELFRPEVRETNVKLSHQDARHIKNFLVELASSYGIKVERGQPMQ